MKQICKKIFQSPCVCRNELSNLRCLTLFVNSTEPRLQTTVRQLRLRKFYTAYTRVVETNYPGMVRKKEFSQTRMRSILAWCVKKQYPGMACKEKIFYDYILHWKQTFLVI